ncbi:hypothetical protein BDF20DRAFT_304770 [Mycotypha africana]|uniref:uncharacterized protein n=1 Tax=Mycotypha africana TaxID=64632 RepID=UPI0023001218|nr:uncharacterized protein BDF20DRAFT_304770 [Mycotypha africana]KAI8988077.1 hypothetical protein BDF20DRAFT_304770 [Mycotypha africana]
MAHALLNTSPVRFFNAIQDHIATVTPSFLNNKASQSSVNNANVAKQQQEKSFHPEPVTLQLTLASEETGTETELNQSTLPKHNAHASVKVPAAPSSTYPLSSSLNSDQPQQPHQQLSVPNDGFLVTPPQQYGLDLLNPTNSAKDDLALQFDALAVASPNGSYYSPQLLASPNSQVTDQFFLAENDFAQPLMVGSFNSAYSQPSQYLSVGSPASQLHVNDNNANVLGINSPASTAHQPIDSNNNYFFLPPGVLGASPQQNTSPYHGVGDAAANHATVSNSASPLADTGLYFTSGPGSPIETKYLFPPADFNAAAAFLDMASFVSQSDQGQQQQQQQASFAAVNDSVTISQFLDTDKINSISTATTTVTPSFTDNKQIEELHFIHESFDNHNTTASHKKENTPERTNTMMTTTPITHAASSHTTQNNKDDEHIENSPTSQSSASVAKAEQPVSKRTQSPSSLQARKTTKIAKSIVSKKGRKKLGRIHRCPFCQHTSNRANNMKEHIQIHNPNRPKPHLCKLCQRPFARKHDMNRHYLSCKKHSTDQPTHINTVTTDDNIHSE